MNKNKIIAFALISVLAIVLVAIIVSIISSEPKYHIYQNVCKNETTLISYQNFTTPYGYPDGSNLVIRSDIYDDTKINVSWSYMSCITSCEPINGTATIDVQPYWEGGIKDEIFQQLWDNKIFPAYQDIEEEKQNSNAVNIYPFLKIDDLQKYGKYETKQVCNLKEVQNASIQNTAPETCFYIGNQKRCWNVFVNISVSDQEFLGIVIHSICSQINSTEYKCGNYIIEKK